MKESPTLLNRVAHVGLVGILSVALFPSLAFADESEVASALDADALAVTLAQQSDVLSQPTQSAMPTIQSSYNYPSSSATTLSPRASELPPSFNLLEQGLATTVKNQGYWGTCWAFGSIASLESNILKQTRNGETTGKFNGSASPDLSELHLAWFAASPITEATDPIQSGEGAQAVFKDNSKTAWETILRMGGFRDNATSTWASWQGATTEASVPYQSTKGTQATNDEWNVPEEERFASTVHVQNIDYLPSPATFTDASNPSKDTYAYDQSATDAIKRILMEKGAVQIGYCADQSALDQTTLNSTYFNYNTWAQCVDEYIQNDDPNTPNFNECTAANHVVTIVGWDDTFSRANFAPNHQPDYDGAWIVKNSWGSNSGWGIGAKSSATGSGCFYLSYYDETIGDISSVQADLPDAEGAFDYDNNYQYDYLGAASVGKVKVGAADFKGVQVANIFTAEGTEALRAVSAMTANPGSQVSVRVYLLDNDAEDPTEGVLATTQEATIEFGGYHTISLDKPVNLSAGQRFAVVETITGAEGNYFPLEIAAEDPGDADVASMGGNMQKVQVAKAAKGQSFYRLGEQGSWTDTTTLTPADLTSSLQLSITGFPVTLPTENAIGNVMIKAFTTNETSVDPEQPAEPDNPDTPVNPDNPADTTPDTDTPPATPTEQVDMDTASTAKKLVSTGDTTAPVACAVTLGALACAGVAGAARSRIRRHEHNSE